VNSRWTVSPPGLSTSSTFNESSFSTSFYRMKLISQLARLNVIILETELSSFTYAQLNYVRIALMKAIISTTEYPIFWRKSGWNLEGTLELRGGMPLKRDFSFANDSSNSDDFTFANTSSEASEDEKDVDTETVGDGSKRFTDFLPSVLYDALKNSTVHLSEPSQPVIKCSKFCNKNCNSVVKSWSGGEVQAIQDIFSNCTKIKLKNELLSQLCFQRSAGLPVTGFFYNGHLLCSNLFNYVSKISIYHINLVTRDFARGCKRYIHGNSNRRKNYAARIQFISWMKVTSENYGQNGPTDIVLVLPSYLNKSELYKIYVNEAPMPHVKKSNFYHLFKTEFGPRRENKSLPWIRKAIFIKFNIPETDE
jgi:hypothetical protein